MRVTNDSYQYNYNVGFEIDLVRYMYILSNIISHLFAYVLNVIMYK